MARGVWLHRRRAAARRYRTATMADDHPSKSPHSERQRRSLKTAASLAAAIALFGLVLYFADLGQLARALRRVRPQWLAAAAVAWLLTSLLRGAYMAVIAALPMRLGRLAAACAATELAGFIAPGPARDVALAGLLRGAADLPTTRALKATAAVRIVEMTTRSLLAAIALFFLPQVAWVRYGLGATAAAIAGAGVTVLLWPQLLVAVLRAVVMPFRRLAGLLGKSADVDAFLDRLLSLRDPALLRRTLPRAVPLLLARWTFFVAHMFAVYRAIGADVGFWQAGYVVLLLGYATALPFRPPADLGTGDAAHAALLISLGWPSADAAAVAVAWRLVSTAIVLAVGGAGLAALAVAPPARDAPAGDLPQ